MTIYFKNTKQKYVLVFDIEFDHLVLIQFSGLLFERVGEDLYTLSRSVNVYQNKKVSYPFTNYTKLNNHFLEENGVAQKDMVQVIEDDFLADIPKNDLLIISHGLKSDITILSHNFINLKYDATTIEPIAGYCTATNARSILKRNSDLTLEDLANESGYYIGQPHDAYHDA
jgi:hypothetical protein